MKALLIILLCLLTAACATCTPIDGYVTGKQHHDGHPTVSVGLDPITGDMKVTSGWDPDRWWLTIHEPDKGNITIRVSQQTYEQTQINDPWVQACEEEK